MDAFTIDPAHLPPAPDLLGAIVCADVRAGARRFRKGQRLTAADLPALADLPRPLHAVHLRADEIHEDVAGLRLAAAVNGGGITARGPVQSRVNLVAAQKGLLRVNAAALLALNRLPGVGVFTLPDRLAVLPGKIVAGAKITPVALPAPVLVAAEALAHQAAVPVVQVKPFRPLVAGVVTTEGLAERARARFRAAVERKMGWYGGRVLGFAEVGDDPREIAATMVEQIAAGADLILAGGGTTIDPLDPTLRALPLLGAEIIRLGAPAHPGSMFWLAHRPASDTPIVNLASCSMYSQATVADLVLPWLMAGERVTADDLAALGYGGLLDRDMGFRFPPYDAEATEERDE